MAIIKRKVEDKDFEVIKIYYHSYLDWKHKLAGKRDKYLTTQDLIDLSKNVKFGANAIESEKWKDKEFLHYGYVAEKDGEVVAYYDWYGGIKTQEKTVQCGISVYKEGEQQIADDLLAYCFIELKKEGFKTALGHMSKRMQENPSFNFLEKYADRKILEVVGGDDLQYQKDL